MSLRGPEYTHGNVATPAEYLQRQAAFLAANVQAFPGRYGSCTLHEAMESTDAYVSEGRWVGMCVCGNGVALSPTWRLGACYSCGRRYRGPRIVWPAIQGDIERLLARRPIANQNWDLGESVAQLAAENAAHGILTDEGV